MQKKISDIPAVRVAVEALLKWGVHDVVLSPGSRNAPFILSFDAIETFQCKSMVDERSAAFVALGIAQQKRKPVVINCTSGSAVLNYAPAVAEAYYQQIPLIVLTADRPARWIDQGEGQSIRQQGVLNNIVAASYSLAEGNEASVLQEYKRIMDQAIGMANDLSQPVHINVPLNEPLYQLADWEWDESLSDRRDTAAAPEAIPAAAISEWSHAPRIMIIVGQQHHEASDALKRLAEDPRVAILTETTGNAHLFGAVACIDRTLETFVGAEDCEAEFIPELLLTIGENIISKKLKALLRRHRSKIKSHWHIGHTPRNTFEALTRTINTTPQRLSVALVNAGSAHELPSTFKSKWTGRFFLGEQAHDEFLATTPWSDLLVFKGIHDLLPDGWDIQMGNSSVVRYIQLFNQVAGWRYFGNRGVSGIEGCTSTAVGAAVQSQRPTLLISGDHAFRYDANGLSFDPLPKNLRIIVINNEGGSIFNIIEGPSAHAASEKFIEKHEQKTVQKLVEYHGAAYMQASDSTSLELQLMELFSESRNECTVLEVFTPRQESPAVLKQYFEYLGSRTNQS